MTRVCSRDEQARRKACISIDLLDPRHGFQTWVATRHEWSLFKNRGEMMISNSCVLAHQSTMFNLNLQHAHTVTCHAGYIVLEKTFSGFNTWSEYNPCSPSIAFLGALLVWSLTDNGTYLGGDVVETTDTHDKDKLVLCWDVDAALGLGVTLQADKVLLLLRRTGRYLHFMQLMPNEPVILSVVFHTSVN